MWRTLKRRYEALVQRILGGIIMSKSLFNNSNNKINKNGEMLEDTTEYGEFVASFDAWMTPEEQKKRAEYLQRINARKR